MPRIVTQHRLRGTNEALIRCKAPAGFNLGSDCITACGKCDPGGTDRRGQPGCHPPSTPQLTGVLVLSFRRSGISALLGLWALLTMGLEGGSPRLPLPAALQLALRPGRRSSFSSASPVLVGLRLGCRGAGDGPPGRGRGQFCAGIIRKSKNLLWVILRTSELLAQATLTTSR